MAKKLLLLVSITIIVCTVGWSVAGPFPAAQGSERAQLKVLKVLSAHDGDALYREYLVNWKDQDVVVRDPLVMTDYEVGDTITVLVIKNKYPNGKPGPDLLSFVIVPR